MRLPFTKSSEEKRLELLEKLRRINAKIDGKSYRRGRKQDNDNKEVYYLGRKTKNGLF